MPRALVGLLVLVAGCSSSVPVTDTQLTAVCDLGAPPRQPLYYFLELPLRDDRGMPVAFAVNDVRVRIPHGGAPDVVATSFVDASAFGTSGTLMPGVNDVRFGTKVAPPDPIPDWCAERYCGAMATATVTLTIGDDSWTQDVPVELGCSI